MGGPSDPPTSARVKLDFAQESRVRTSVSLLETWDCFQSIYFFHMIKVNHKGFQNSNKTTYKRTKTTRWTWKGIWNGAKWCSICLFTIMVVLMYIFRTLYSWLRKMNHFYKIFKGSNIYFSEKKLKYSKAKHYVIKESERKSNQKLKPNHRLLKLRQNQHFSPQLVVQT